MFEKKADKEKRLARAEEKFLKEKRREEIARRSKKAIEDNESEGSSPTKSLAKKEEDNRTEIQHVVP